VSWDPTQYLRFADHRTRPALELLARIEAGAPRLVVDLGCGAGNVTAYLRARWPQARIVAVDSSPQMLDRARRDHPDLRVEWIEADASAWTPDDDVDVIYSNALVHWLDEHDQLLPRWLGYLAPTGELALQMPRNHARPSHTCAVEAAAAGPWAERLRSLVRPEPVGSPRTYHRLLAPLARRIDLWETDYVHALAGPDAVVEWTRGSLLRPLLAVLDDVEAVAFEDEYRARVRDAYPAEPDGTVLMPFRRLFLVAARGD
jgi:trans-aconitate 2-methyltransferase